MMERLHDQVDFVLIYVREAHAVDEWRLDNAAGISIKQHSSLQERLDAAHQMQSLFEFSSNLFLIDGMDDSLCSTFAIWPERFLVADQNKVIQHISMPTSEFGYDHRCIESAALALLGKEP